MLGVSGGVWKGARGVVQLEDPRALATLFTTPVCLYCESFFYIFLLLGGGHALATLFTTPVCLYCESLFYTPLTWRGARFSDPHHACLCAG